MKDMESFDSAFQVEFQREPLKFWKVWLPKLIFRVYQLCDLGFTCLRANHLINKTKIGMLIFRPLQSKKYI